MTPTTVREGAGASTSVVIAMAVAVSLPFLIAIPGVLASLTDSLPGGSRNDFAFWVTFVQNGAALAACVSVLRGTKRYWLPVIASLLTFVGWFWLSFSSLPLALVLLGTIISVPIGIWAFRVLRSTEVRSRFEGQFDPVDFIGRFLLPRLPKMNAEPTPGNISRFTVLGLSGLCVVGLLLGALLGNPGDSWHREVSQQDRARSAAATGLLKQADQKWTSGKKDEAVEDYLQLTSMETGPQFSRDQSSGLSRAYCRAIEWQADRGDGEAARDLIRKALRVRVPKITFTLANSQANRVLTEERRLFDAEQEKQHQERWAEEKAKQDYVRRRVAESADDNTDVDNLEWPTGMGSGWLDNEGSGKSRGKGSTIRWPTSEGRTHWMNTPDGQAWLGTPEGKEAMKTPEGQKELQGWMNTPEGQKMMDKNVENLNKAMRAGH